MALFELGGDRDRIGTILDGLENYKVITRLLVRKLFRLIIIKLSKI